MARMSAYRAKDLKPVWTFQQRAPFLTSAMTTAGGVGFVGDWDRTFRAFDVKTGKTLWTTRLGTTAQGFPTTYRSMASSSLLFPPAIMAAARGAGPSRCSPSSAIARYAGHAVYVFALPSAVRTKSPK